jgi:phosphohistidine phosphatase
MRLTLLRHGPAIDVEKWSGADSDRPLTDAGIEVTKKLVTTSQKLIKAVEIWTSPAVRTRQTAEIASSIWKLPIRDTEWLSTGAITTGERASRLHVHTDVVLIGHEPDLSELVRFLCGAKIELKKAGIVILRGLPRQGEMLLHALYSPKHAQRLHDI